MKISSLVCGLDYSDYTKSFISRINEVYFSIKYRYSIFFFTTRRLFWNVATVCYCFLRLDVCCGMLQSFVIVLALFL